MIVKVDREVFRVKFVHDHKRSKKVAGRTECFIDWLGTELMPAESTLSGYGLAVCMRPDIFSKAKGRRVSLTKALADGDYERSARKVFWATYLSQCSDFK